VRIIAGFYKGRVLKVPAHIRPTQDNVRKAVFDIMGDIVSLSFLELFAGSGAIGLEALSRGAAPVVFVESHSACARAVNENIKALGAQDTCFVIHQDAARAIEGLCRSGKKFDVVFLDPPYYEDTAKNVLITLEAYDIVAPAGVVIVQHFKKDLLPEKTAHLAQFKQNRYGDTLVSFYHRI